MPVIPAFFIGLHQPGRHRPADPLHRGDGRGHRHGAGYRGSSYGGTRAGLPGAVRCRCGVDRAPARDGVRRRRAPVRVVVRHHARLAGVGHPARAGSRWPASAAACSAYSPDAGCASPAPPRSMVVAVVAIDMVGQMPVAYDGTSELRLWVPWAMFHSGSETDGTAALFAGNAGFYLVYLLCLCAAAALVAIWHDRTARTGRLRTAIVGVIVVGLACARTGHDHRQRRQPALEADPLQDQQVMLVGWYLRRAIPWMALLGCCAGGPAAGRRAGPVAVERAGPAPRPGRRLRRGRGVLLRRGVRSRSSRSRPAARPGVVRRDSPWPSCPSASGPSSSSCDPGDLPLDSLGAGGWSGSPPSRSPSAWPRSPRATRSPAPGGSLASAVVLVVISPVVICGVPGLGLALPDR